MRIKLQVLFLLMGGLLGIAPGTTTAEDCPSCVLGIWDDQHLTRNYGYSKPGEPKIVYVGLRSSDPADAYGNVEFSIAGLRPEDGMYVLAVSCSQGGVPSCIGSVSSPADTTATSSGIGGLVTSWFDCFGGVQPLIAVMVLHLEPKTGHVLQVKRRYPTSNPAWRTPVLFSCIGAPSAVRVSAGCYVLNPAPGQAAACALENVPVESPTWSRVKHLYRG